jgi:hypothetical protein
LSASAALAAPTLSQPSAGSPAPPTRAAPGPSETAFTSSGDGGALKLDRPRDLAPAGSFAVAGTRAIFRTKSDELTALPLDPKSTDIHDEPAASTLSSGPPPALTRTHAYWISQSRLVRRSLPSGQGAPDRKMEVLAQGALDGARVVAGLLTPPGGAPREVSIYIAQAENEKDDRRARIWVEGAQAAPFSADGSGASSLALVVAGGAARGVSLDARSAMSPLHARSIEVGAQGAPRLGPDVVVFVGPSPEGQVEIAAAWGPDGLTVLAPFSRHTSSFGLASLFVGDEPHVDAPVHWSMYPNGIEPAPVAAAAFCGRTWAAFARPSGPSPGAIAELVLAPIDHGVFGPEIITGQGSDFTMVSLVPRDEGGAWLAWIGNGRSWARGIRC